MNLLDAYVEEVLSEPYEKYGKYWVKVAYTCWSNEFSEQELMFDTYEDALAVGPGYKFLT